MTEAPKRKRRKPWRQATEHTRRYYERAGYRIAFVERQIKLRASWGGKLTRRVDAWNFADHIAFKVGKPGMVAINSCKGFRELALHVEKFRLLSAAWDWLVHDPNNRIVILAWERPAARGLRVRMRCRQLRKSDFEPRIGDCCEWKPKGVKRKAGDSNEEMTNGERHQLPGVVKATATTPGSFQNGKDGANVRYIGTNPSEETRARAAS